MAKIKKTVPKPTYMGGGGGAGRGTNAGAGAAAAVGKTLKRKATGIKDAKGLEKMKKALKNQTPPKRTTPASKPTSQLERNIGRISTLRRKFPEKYNPTVKKK